MKKVWVVEGSTGEYSDHQEWPVAFYKTEKEAQKCVEFLTEMSGVARTLGKKEKEFMSQFDTSYDRDYIGTNYWCFEVPLGVNYSKRIWTKEKIQMIAHLYQETKQ
jgi:hypothetical protein